MSYNKTVSTAYIDRNLHIGKHLILKMNQIEVGSIERSGKSIYHWKIPEFSEYYRDLNVCNYVVSPVFSTSNSAEGFRWQLKLNGARYVPSARRFLCLYVECLSYEFRKAIITTGILKNNGTILEEKSKEYKKSDTTLTLYDIAEMEYLTNPANEILNGNILTIQCKISMGNIQPVHNISSFKVVSSSGQRNEVRREISLRLEEFDDFESMLNDPHFSDVSISIEGKNIMACKLILMKRSPVFAAMFRADMKEQRKNVVLIKDIKYDVFMELLRFVYSGKVRQLEVIAVDLLVAADKYQMENLKNLCESELVKQLSVDGAVRILKLADKHCAKKLKKLTIGYIVENRIDIFDQAEFRGLRKELMYEVCQAMK